MYGASPESCSSAPGAQHVIIPDHIIKNTAYRIFLRANFVQAFNILFQSHNKQKAEKLP